MRPNDVQARRRRLTDFDSDDAYQRWLVVNDDVMGGQSLGGLSFDAGILTFFPAPGAWQTISVSFDELSPAIFGRPIDDLPFRKDLATRMGLLISDGVDCPFRLEIDWIDLVTDDT